MALEVTSSTMSGMQKVAKPVEAAPEQRAVNKTADVTTQAASSQIERQVTARAEQDGVATREQQGENGAQNKNSAEAKRIQSAVKRANHSMKMQHTSCQFVYHEETNRVSIKVMDDDTNEVIREIPSEEALELVQRMWEMAGILVDERR